MLRLDGKALANKRQEQLAQRISQDNTPSPYLCVILVGEDPASQIYVRNKVKACQKVGIASRVHHLPAEVSDTQLHQLIIQLNQNKEVSGILIQLPLPPHLDKHKVFSWLAPTKDVDGLCVENVGRMWGGNPRILPCTPNGIMKILEFYNIHLKGQHAVVLGRSSIVGLPMAYLLQKAQATVTICHSHTKDLPYYTKQADILVVAVGQPQMVGREHVKNKSTVIDVGIHRQDKDPKLCGDVRYKELEEIAFAITPVPGGVGPMTISMLLENTYHLACASHTTNYFGKT